MVKIGVLALQGDFLEHVQMMREIGIDTKPVKNHRDLADIDGLVIPGGESTTIGSLLKTRGLDQEIITAVSNGLPVMGTCAGAILLAKNVSDRVVGETGQHTLGLMNISVIRNIYGRQVNSFIARVDIEEIGEVTVAFIRAPGITSAWSPARITGYVDHPVVGRIGCAAIQGHMIAFTFHPEITGERKIYDFFMKLVKR